MNHELAAVATHLQLADLDSFEDVSEYESVIGTTGGRQFVISLRFDGVIDIREMVDEVLTPKPIFIGVLADPTIGEQLETLGLIG